MERVDEPALVEDTTLPEDAKWFFISHNYRDFTHAINLRKLLVDKGYGGWIFEAEIPQRELIIPNVRDAIKKCDFFITYVTRQSIGSLWVKKELGEALRNHHIKTFIFIDGEDLQLCELFQEWKPNWGHNNEKAQSFCLSCNETNNRWKERCESFICEFHEYISYDNPTIATFPEFNRIEECQGKHLQLQNFGAFLTSLKN